jgi:WD40 repeat protein
VATLTHEGPVTAVAFSPDGRRARTGSRDNTARLGEASTGKPVATLTHEGRISVAKRRHGLARCRYKGLVGMNRSVALGLIADNIVNIGRAMEKQTAA